MGEKDRVDCAPTAERGTDRRPFVTRRTEKRKANVTTACHAPSLCTSGLC